MTNTKYWDLLGRTDPAHTKSFKRAGGFSGTAIKPMWVYRRMTEEFGPAGKGWGVDKPDFDVVTADDEIMVYCTVGAWYRETDDAPMHHVYGVGGDKVLGKNKNGSFTDDEAFKKAFTDALTNALKLIGVGADVHMGMFDDNKYVNDMKNEFASAKEPPLKSSAAMKRDDFWGEFEAEIDECMTLAALEQRKAYWRKRAVDDGWPLAWKGAAKDLFEGAEKRIMDEIEAEEGAQDGNALQAH